MALGRWNEMGINDINGECTYLWMNLARTHFRTSLYDARFLSIRFPYRLIVQSLAYESVDAGAAAGSECVASVESGVVADSAYAAAGAVADAGQFESVDLV